jgi:hypothetical protein
MKRLLVGLLLLFCGGCATLLTEDTQNITITSCPVGAEATIGPYSCICPCVLQIPKGQTYSIDVKYQGQKQSVPLTKKVAGTTFINILFFPGFIVDAITGDIKKYAPTEYSFVFSEKSGAAISE